MAAPIVVTLGVAAGCGSDGPKEISNPAVPTDPVEISNPAFPDDDVTDANPAPPRRHGGSRGDAPGQPGTP